MTRLIDADDIVLDYSGLAYIPPLDFEGVAEEFAKQIDAMPTVDAVPVRHGKWIDRETFKRPWYRHHIFECSVCRNILDMDGVNAGRGDANYCPNCGARMDEEKEE